MITSMNGAREQRLRRLAARKGLSLHKVRYGSRNFWEYGPYYLADAATSFVLDRGMQDLDDVAKVLTER
jgi:hypothetical protein